MRLGFRTCGSTAAGSLKSYDDIVDGLVTFGFICDEFYFRLCGVCCCKNGGAHDQIFSQSQQLAIALIAISDGVYVLLFMFGFSAEPLVSKGWNRF